MQLGLLNNCLLDRHNIEKFTIYILLFFGEILNSQWFASFVFRSLFSLFFVRLKFWLLNKFKLIILNFENCSLAFKFCFCLPMSPFCFLLFLWFLDFFHFQIFNLYSFLIFFHFFVRENFSFHLNWIKFIFRRIRLGPWVLFVFIWPFVEKIIFGLDLFENLLNFFRLQKNSFKAFESSLAYFEKILNFVSNFFVSFCVTKETSF